MRLNLGCGEDTRDGYRNVDLYDLPGVDETHDLNDYPWPWDDASIDEILANHVFEHLEDMERALRESARVLRSGATLHLSLPMGRDAYADATHVWGTRHLPWTWRTPEFYTGTTHWDEDLSLELVDRSVSVWSVHPSQVVRGVQQWWWKYKLERYGPGEWCFGLSPMCGEFQVVFRKP